MPLASKLRKLGLAGFIFFTVKGLLWLIIPGAVVAYRGCGPETPAEAAESSTPTPLTTAAETSP